ncbi:MAG TPA: class I SAM-dependent methyltransferase [Acidimicrobiia bacterium]|nr:class I SAM-dependent methyltransferase [Acidimicrobiia bacterium]
MPTDPQEAVRRFFDDYGDREWDRLEVDWRARVSFELHRRFLSRFVSSGMRVLDIGAGAGRFTIELVRLGATVHVADLSQVQLDLNARYVSAAGCEHGVASRQRLDVCDLSVLGDAGFDAVVAYGGPLSYVFDRAPSALAEMVRVVRPGGHVLASVMTLAGNARYFLDSFLPVIDEVGLDRFEAFLAAGDQRLVESAGAHACQLMRWVDIEPLVSAAGAELVAASASNWLSLAAPETVEVFTESPELWARFLDWEERLCAEPGAVEGGTHLLFRARRPGFGFSL